MIRVGLLGRGLGGATFHAPLIRAVEGMDLVAMVGRADCAATIADPNIDLIVVSTPDSTHFDLAEAALRAGKHVVVDKPFTNRSADARRLIEIAIDQGRVLAPFHNRRWDGDFLTVKELCRSQVLGEISLFEAHWDRFQPDVEVKWREEAGSRGGALWNLGPHLVDQALLLFGMPDALSADMAAQRGAAKVDDYFVLTLHYGNKRVILGASNLVHAPRPRFAIHGSRGSFVKHGLDGQEGRLKSGENACSAHFGENSKDDDGLLCLAGASAERIRTKNGAYLGFYRQVADAIAEKGPPPVDPRDAEIGVHLLELAESAAKDGSTARV